MFVFLAGLVLCCFHEVVSSNSSSITCTNSSYCYQQYGYASECFYGQCKCDDFFYLHAGITPRCEECPGIGESCAEANCCNRNYLECHDGVCLCIYEEYCWTVSESDRERFQRVAQFVLAVALILTATILFILFWKACTRRSLVRRPMGGMIPADSFLSLNSIQRLVLMQLQDRPPPYNAENMHPWKNANEITEPPPSYIEAVGTNDYDYTQGQENHTFVLGEIPPIMPPSEETFNLPPVNSSWLFQNTVPVLQSTTLPTHNVIEPLQNTEVPDNSTTITLQNADLPSVAHASSLFQILERFTLENTAPSNELYI